MIEGTKLQFWNFPADEGVNHPVEVLDLKGYRSCSVEDADRKRCPRARTMMLEVTAFEGERRRGLKNMRYLLHCDDLVEYKKWRNALEMIVQSFRSWKVFNHYEEIV